MRARPKSKPSKRIQRPEQKSCYLNNLWKNNFLSGKGARKIKSEKFLIEKSSVKKVWKKFLRWKIPSQKFFEIWWEKFFKGKKESDECFGNKEDHLFNLFQNFSEEKVLKFFLGFKFIKNFWLSWENSVSIHGERQDLEVFFLLSKWEEP